jgi:hypothetical protein
MNSDRKLEDLSQYSGAVTCGIQTEFFVSPHCSRLLISSLLHLVLLYLTDSRVIAIVMWVEKASGICPDSC